MHAIDRATHRIDQQAVLHGGGFQARMRLQRRIERGLAVAVGHELHTDEQAASTDIAQVGMVTQHLA
ncbi:hypothetical protein D3C86_1940130 [compost metagenome]